MRIQFHGLCLVATDEGKLLPAADEYVTLLLPENSPRLKHRDGHAAIRHTPHMIIPAANVLNPGEVNVITSTGKEQLYVAMPLSKVDVSFQPDPKRPTDAPSGVNVTLGLSKLVDFEWFTDDITLNPLVEQLHRDSRIDSRSDGALRVATRVRLRGGYFHTVDANSALEWSYEFTLAKTHKSPPTSGVATELWFTAEMPDRFQIVLTPFDGSAPVVLDVVDPTGDLVIQLGNECLPPQDWDNETASCRPKEHRASVRDTDFKAHYELLESSDEHSIEARLGNRELPVPTITDHSFKPEDQLAIAVGADSTLPRDAAGHATEAAPTLADKPITMGSEWCQRALIQVMPEE